MSRRPWGTAAAALCLALGLALMTPATASAKGKLDPVLLDRVARLVPFVSKADVKRQIMLLADAANISPNKAAKKTRIELRRKYKEFDRKTQKVDKKKADEEVLPALLPRARHKGDIYYSPNQTHYIIFGHNGIYSSKDTVIEAPGGQPGESVHEVSILQTYVFTGAKVGSVVNKKGKLVSYKKRNKAVKWARSKLGSLYNTNPLNTYYKPKGQPGSTKQKATLNCSQLIWGAYYYGAGIDLDEVNFGNRRGGLIWGWIDRMSVIPIELAQTPRFKRYKTVREQIPGYIQKQGGFTAEQWAEFIKLWS